MLESIETLNLWQHKKEGTIWYQNQIITLQSFSQKIYWLQKLKKPRMLMNRPVYLGLQIQKSVKQ